MAAGQREAMMTVTTKFLAAIGVLLNTLWHRFSWMKDRSHRFRATSLRSDNLVVPCLLVPPTSLFFYLVVFLSEAAASPGVDKSSMGFERLPSP